MYTIRWLGQAESDYSDLEQKAHASRQKRKAKGWKKSSKNEGLFKQVSKTIDFLKNDPRHPGLQTHPYSSLQNPYNPNEKVFEAYAQNKTPGAYRVFWCYGPGKGEITIIAITPHP
jgi:hypothetical protein